MAQNCKGCGSCCAGPITVVPFDGDRVGDYRTVPMPLELWANVPAEVTAERREGVRLLETNPDGTCAYLTVERECLIYWRRPQVCRDYPNEDCDLGGVPA